MMTHQKILLVDDHTLFREGLRVIIEKEDRFEIIGEAGSAKEALRLIEKDQPDIIVMDVSLPDTNGIDLTYEIRKQWPNIRILVVSMHSKVDYIAEAFKAGATGYVVKDAASNRLIEGLESVAKGMYFMDSSVSMSVVNRLLQGAGQPLQPNHSSEDDHYNALTPREQEILRLLAEGLSNKQIAEKLFISQKTVQNHRNSIKSKLNLHTTVDIIRYAARLGLIDVDLWKE
jgi:DNA-binding NarL/FixJ family response regulator